jgi:hypothetical protein
MAGVTAEMSPRTISGVVADDVRANVVIERAMRGDLVVDVAVAGCREEEAPPAKAFAAPRE